uniref:8-amino-7-oxononanoate synthase n=1 Tax=mine drainage metagenome TaxID=410659 RepID=E6QRD7_9ZZZZ
MSFAALERLRAGLAQRRDSRALRHRQVLESAQGTYVNLSGQTWLSFCSNDYLGLANHPALIAAVCEAAPKMGVGAGASHLVCGHHVAHQEFELAFAEFVGAPAALSFSTGYMANLAVVMALIGRTGAIFADKLNHASLNDAALLSRARVSRFAHRDLAGLEQYMSACTQRDKLVISDGVFSMDGDMADVPGLLALCEKYDAWLLIDDAHGFGVLGASGQGILAHYGVQSPRIIYLATLGKAAGVAGAVVAGESEVIEWLIQTARTYIYTTAAPPMLSVALSASLREIARAAPQRARLGELIAQLRAGLQQQGWPLMDSRTPIQPVVLGSNATTLAVSERLAQQHIWVPAIRPPTVPENTGRLRITLSAQHTTQDVARLLDALGNFHGK